MKYLICGDTHGKSETVNKILSSLFYEYKKVFVGDYVDSFRPTVEAQIQIVRDLLDAVDKRDDVVALLGNHELSYIKRGMRCSGYNTITAMHLGHLEDEMYMKFKTHYYITDDLLVTHAGATNQIFGSKEQVKESLENNDPCLYNIGYYRGGTNNYGGTFWCDYWAEFEEVKGLTQIVGHSSYRPTNKYEGVVLEKGCYNIDCLDRINEVLTYDTKTEKFEVINLDDYE